MISTVNEWDPLKAIVVGTATHANWPSSDPVFALESEKTTWTETPVPAGPVPQWIIDETNADLDLLCETLLRFGVTVYRPQPMDFVANQEKRHLVDNQTHRYAKDLLWFLRQIVLEVHD